MNQLENDEEMNNNNNKVSITKTSNYLIFFLYSKMENFWTNISFFISESLDSSTSKALFPNSKKV